jgi:hypothetical protein
MFNAAVHSLVIQCPTRKSNASVKDRWSHLAAKLTTKPNLLSIADPKEKIANAKEEFSMVKSTMRANQPQ